MLWFYIYSFLGWICETIYCSIPAKKFVKRGMIKGPICPIYGFGALFVITLLDKYRGNIFIIFILGLIMTSILEFFTSFCLEKVFNRKWWDYSKNKLNIKGRVCLLNSTMFGSLSVCLIEFIHPMISMIIIEVPIYLLNKITRGILAIFIIDTGLTFLNLYKTRKEILN
ncbi:Putative membrane protein [Clostridium chauvoei JF4335]|nr:hypothetical protein C6H62_06600 [Clostridium chauvoei]CDG01729.1 Putative membrane protein [Clostridium chauvoei JF4335]